MEAVNAREGGTVRLGQTGDEETTSLAGHGTSAGASLLVVCDTFVAAFPLPESGELTVGRSTRADLFLDHSSISRMHATVRAEDRGQSLTVEDLGSANGTFVGGERLVPGERRCLAIGDAFALANVQLIVQRGRVAEPTTTWTHARFEARVERECADARARGARGGDGPTIVRIDVIGSCDVGTAHAIFAGFVAPRDVIAGLGANAFEILLTDTHVHALASALARLRGAFERRGFGVRIGVASFPEQGTSAVELIAAATHGMSGTAAHATSDAAVFTSEGPMRQVLSLVERVAPSDATCLLVGETGVGKEILAGRIHALSGRQGKPFVKLNCAAVPEQLLESELFGFERGAFSGATQAKPGLLETADGGTVLLDEVGEMPLALQAKLLRVLEESRVQRLGAVKPRAVDVRFLASTNRDLEGEVRVGRFRADLYYRIATLVVSIPALRFRVSEILPLASALLRAVDRKMGVRRERRFSAAAEAALEQHPWPGNVRELRNVMTRTAVLCGEDVVDVVHLRLGSDAPSIPPPLTTTEPPAASRLSIPLADAVAPGAGATAPAGLKEAIEHFERDRIVSALERAGGNQTAAAKSLGLSRGALVARIEAYGLPRPRKDKRS